MSTPQSSSDDTLNYGGKLYNHKHFDSWFRTFSEDQEKSASLIWDRVLERCGKDQDLPPITHIVDYGCGEGTFLKYLHESYQKAKDAGRTPELTFKGIDCCPKAIEKAKTHINISEFVAPCLPCPKEALENLFPNRDQWKTTALMVMGHSWFHFDQECLVETLLSLRPAIILVDVYQSWNDVITRLHNGNTEEMEHGRRFEDGSTYWLRTAKREDGKVSRGIYHIPATGESKWEFVTCQHPKTTDELFGGLSPASEKKLESNSEYTPEKALLQACTSGDFVKADKTNFRAYLHDRQYLHNTGWGPMECHVLVSLNPISRLLNAAWFKVISSLIEEAVPKHDETGTTSVGRMIELFNDPRAKTTIKTKGDKSVLPGSREALVVLPFEPNATSVRILPLDGQDNKISEFPLLVEHPTRWQTQFPSANGVFQTCLGHSSSAQAFPTSWAHDYDLTPADKALQKLELEVLGLDPKGVWSDDTQPASYFMVPFYRGSLPLFCLALKFPQNFAPETTAFDVYQSTIKSLHDAIQTILNDELVLHRVIRPWIEECLTGEWPEEHSDKSVEWKLSQLEEILFGVPYYQGAYQTGVYKIGTEKRRGGVLSREWKSWLLGLPSFPINKMDKVIDENRRLWEIWNEERRIALLDAPLRISLWFQEGRFFEDKAHDQFVCSVHLPRLQRMFSEILHYEIKNKEHQSSEWLSEAIQWLEDQATAEESCVARYFGKENVKHFLFDFLIRHLKALCDSRMSCKHNSGCLNGNSNLVKCCAENSFQAIKTVFCKTNANTGDGIRFGLARLFYLLDAARLRLDKTIAGNINPVDPVDLNKLDEKIGMKFWSKDDPSIQIAEFVHCLAIMGVPKTPAKSILDNLTISVSGNVVEVISAIKIQLKENIGGSDKHQLDQVVEKIRRYCAVSEIHNEDTITITFSIDSEGAFKPFVKS